MEHLQMCTPVIKLMLDFSLICNCSTHCKILPFTARLHLTLICAFTETYFFFHLESRKKTIGFFFKLRSLLNGQS